MESFLRIHKHIYIYIYIYIYTYKAFSRVKSAPVSMSFSRTLTDFLFAKRVSVSHNVTLCLSVLSLSAAVSRLSRTVDMISPALGLFCAVCTSRKLDSTSVVRKPRTYHSNSEELSVQRLSCSMWRILFFSSRLPKASDSSIFVFVLPSQWAFEHELCMLSKGFPFPHQVSTVPIEMRITYTCIHFTFHLWTYLADSRSVHQDASVLKHFRHFWHHFKSLCGLTKGAGKKAVSGTIFIHPQ